MKKPTPKEKKLIREIEQLREKNRRLRGDLQELNPSEAKIESILRACYSAVEEARKYASFLESNLHIAYEGLPKYKRVSTDVLNGRFKLQKDDIKVDMREFDYLIE